MSKTSKTTQAPSTEPLKNTAWKSARKKQKQWFFQKGNTGLQCNINIENEQIEQVDHFKYLGSLFTENGDSSKEIEARIAIATAVVNKAKTLWKNSGISTKTKFTLLRTLVLSCFLYGCETWTITKNALMT